MGAYPALLVQPPQQQDVLGQLGRVAALKSMLMQQSYQQQMQPLQLQEAQNQIQQQQNALAIQQRQVTSMDAFQKAAQADPKASVPELLQKTVDNGGHLIDVMPWFDNLLKFQQGIAGLQGTQADTAKKVAETVGSGSEQLLNTPPQDRPQLFQSTIAPMWRDAGVPENQIQATKLDDQSLQGHRFLGLQAGQVIEAKTKEKEFAAKYGPIDPARLQLIQNSMNTIATQNGIQPVTLPPGTTEEGLQQYINLFEASGRAAERQGQLAIANGFRQQSQNLAAFMAQVQTERLNKPPEEIQNRATLAGTFSDPLSVIKDVVTRRQDLVGPAAGRSLGARALVSKDQDLQNLNAAINAIKKNTENARSMPNMGNLPNLMDDVAKGVTVSPKQALDAIDKAQTQINEFKQAPEQYRSGAVTGITSGMVPGAKPLPPRPGAQFSVTVGPNTYTFKDQKSLDAFKQKAGIQ